MEDIEALVAFTEDIESLAFTETYYYGIGLVYEKSSTAGILIYHYDHLGSTTAITDKNGELVYGFTYGTYGELNETIEYSESTPRITFLYNGQLGVSTDENGLYYMTNRYYNPEIKRFIKRDILTGNIGNNASLNQYSYVEGNPVSYTDPFGLSPFAFLNLIDKSTITHAVLDVLGALPGGAIFDLANAALYFVEKNPTEGIKALVFMVPGLDLAGKGTKFAAKFGKGGDVVKGLAELADAGGHLAAAGLAAKDLGDGVAGMIDKYLVNGEEVTATIGLEILCLGASGFQVFAFSGSFINKFNNGSYGTLTNIVSGNRGSSNLGLNGIGGSYDGGSNAELGNKLDYQFGKAGGNKHNIDRSNGLKAEMDKLGFDDIAENRAYFEQYYNDILNDSSNIVGVPETASYMENGVTHYYTVTTRESFLMGKYGGAKVTTYWEENRLLTIIIGSGKQTRYNH